MKRIIGIAFSLLFIVQINAQIIVVDPAFPTADQAAMLTLNTVGTGLEGYTGDVYTHTGVTVNGTQWSNVIGDWGDNENQPKLTNIGTDLFELEITPSIREFYGVGSSGVITELCLVFRSADGSQQTSDLFYNVYESGLAIQITMPTENPIIVEENDPIQVEGNTNEADSTFLFIDNQRVYADTGNTFSYNIIAENSGKTWVKAIATNGIESVADSFYYFVRPPLTVEDPPPGTVDGINYIDDNTVILSLYAPEKEFVFAAGDFSDWELDEEYFMKRSTDGKRYWVQIDNLEAGKEYIYQYLIDGEILVGDIYADKVSDPWNDHWIDEETYPNMLEYPEGKTFGIATVFQTAQEEYEWEIEEFTGPEPTNMIIYELLVRDFIDAHRFDVLIDTLDYLKKLGVNVIELMPVNEFEGNLSWGYNSNFYFAPDKYYGPKNSFKAFIDECHKQGFAVVIDMVLNHAFNSCPLVHMYWDQNNNHPAANNPWFNTVSPNPVYAWGSDFNHESQDTKDFVDRVNRYWIEEYKVDGFRFDFTKGFTNKPGDGGGFDQSRIDILTRMADEIWSYEPDAYVILEHFANNSEEKILANEGMLIWGNTNYNYNEATMGWNDNSDFSWISYKKRGWNEPHVVGYMESHDEERLMFKNITYGNGSGAYQTTDTATSLARLELAGAFFFTIPGPKMIWQFGEMGYDISINTCEDGSINETCRTHPKPIHWDYMESWKRNKLYYTWRALIELRKNHDVFRSEDFELNVDGPMKKIRLTSTEMSVVILGNFDVVEGSINPEFYETGTWYDYFSGESIEIMEVNAPISLEAGEYIIYTSKKLDSPEYLAIDEVEIWSEQKLLLYPNPARNEINISTDESLGNLTIFNLMGQQLISTNPLNNNKLTVDISNLDGGIYLIKAQSEDGKILTAKFLKD